MNKKFEKKICYYFDNLLNTVTFDERKSNKLLLIELYVPKVKEEWLKESIYNLVGILEIKYLLFGKWGECGLVVFLDFNLNEILRLAYEDSDSTHNTHSWFIKELLR